MNEFYFQNNTMESNNLYLPSVKGFLENLVSDCQAMNRRICTENLDSIKLDNTLSSDEKQKRRNSVFNSFIKGTLVIGGIILFIQQFKKA